MEGAPARAVIVFQTKHGMETESDLDTPAGTGLLITDEWLDVYRCFGVD